MSTALRTILLTLLMTATCRAADEYGPSLLTAADIPTPIVRTEAGDWASYALDDRTKSKLTVLERFEAIDGDDRLVIENRITKKRGKKKREYAEKEQVSLKDRIADQRDLGPEDYVTSATMLVRGRKLDVVIVNYVERGRLVKQSYFSDQVPVYGLVRGVVHNGSSKTIAIDLRDFGSAGDEE